MMNKCRRRVLHFFIISRKVNQNEDSEELKWGLPQTKKQKQVDATFNRKG